MYKFHRDQVLDPEFLTKLVERFKKEYVPRFIRDQKYYEVETEILKRTMTDGKPNNRLAGISDKTGRTVQKGVCPAFYP